MLLDDDFNYEAQKRNTSVDKNMYDFFFSSDCIENISLFGDRFKIAVKMK